MKSFFKLFLMAGVLCIAAATEGCTINPATGQKQFAALMSPAQEEATGAQEHAKIMHSFGGPFEDPALEAYIQRIGARISANTERPDVDYKFFVLDTPMVNAFALPGGYIYVSRGLLAQANSEAEVAAVLAHEVGHITARHSAERYSRGVLASVGTVVLAAATDNDRLLQAAGLGSELYMKSYSRGQESQADELGIRYLARAGYDPASMASFLANLDQYTQYEEQRAGSGQPQPFNYFSTHPRTADRVADARAMTAQYPQAASEDANAAGYLQAMNGLVYGDSAAQGFARGHAFYHPEMGFTFSVPDNFRLNNAPEGVTALGPDGAVILFDMAATGAGMDAFSYMTQGWMKGEPLTTPESILIDGMPAATAAFEAVVNGRKMTVRIVAIEWAPTKFFRFQMAVPYGTDSRFVEGLKKTTYSFRRMTDAEKAQVRPYRIRVVTAAAGDTVETLAARMVAEGGDRRGRFAVLNALAPGEKVVPGRLYKVVAEE